jgi:hypothetical protein
LWHGIPLKKIENDISKGPLRYLYNPANFRRVVEKTFYITSTYKKNDAVLTTSNHLIKISPAHSEYLGIKFLLDNIPG